jgi:formylglycine-generating enzyme required for sulfatase activity
MAKDAYEILQIASHAEQTVIEGAYRRLAQKYHPDVNSSPDAVVRMREINWAYEILKDPLRRSDYDHNRRSEDLLEEPLTAVQIREARFHERYIEPALVYIPAGMFWMGSDENDYHAFDVEKPRHQLYLPGFWIARSPETNDAYRLFLLDMPDYPAPYGWKDREYPPGTGDHPITGISWYDAIAYCTWISLVSNEFFTLPSEAEWEKAARSPQGFRYPWGDRWIPNCCNNLQSRKKHTTPVGSFSPQGDSIYGCTDMAGNAWEWTRSVFVDYPYDAADGREVQGRTNNDPMVLRGGSFSSTMRQVRCTCRDQAHPSFGSRTYGFRLVIFSNSHRG